MSLLVSTLIRAILQHAYPKGLELQGVGPLAVQIFGEFIQGEISLDQGFSTLRLSTFGAG